MDIGGIVTRGCPKSETTWAVGSPFERQMQHVIIDLATLMRVRPEDLDVMVWHCGSLFAVAANQGVSEWRLIDTIKQSLVDGGSTLGGHALEELARRIATERVEAERLGRVGSVPEPSGLRISPASWRGNVKGPLT